MPTSVKADLLGSQLTRGQFNAQFDRAVRLARVDGLPNDNDDLQTAIAAVQAALGGAHQSVSNLPLRRITARKSGSLTRARVRLDYGRTSSSTPEAPAYTLARFRAAPIARRWYRLPFDTDGNPTFDSDGRPNGPIHGLADPSDAGTLPRPYTYTVPGVRIYVPTQLSSNAYTAVGGKLEKINQDSTSMGSITFLAWRLRFEGLDVDAVVADGATVYPTSYVYHVVQSGHVEEQAYYDTTTSLWTTRVAPAYQLTNFNGAFPVHA